jgi:PAS domain S-box-containing protein
MSTANLENNRALEGMLGYSVEEMRRMTVGQLTHPDDTASIWEQYRELVEGQRESFQT